MADWQEEAGLSSLAALEEGKFKHAGIFWNQECLTLCANHNFIYPTPTLLEGGLLLEQGLLLPQQLRPLLRYGRVVLDRLSQGLLLAFDFILGAKKINRGVLVSQISNCLLGLPQSRLIL